MGRRRPTPIIFAAHIPLEEMEVMNYVRTVFALPGSSFFSDIGTSMRDFLNTFCMSYSVWSLVGLRDTPQLLAQRVTGIVILPCCRNGVRVC